MLAAVVDNAGLVVVVVAAAAAAAVRRLYQACLQCECARFASAMLLELVCLADAIGTFGVAGCERIAAGLELSLWRHWHPMC